MLKKIVPISLFTLFSIVIQAQEFCGTPPYRSQALINFQQNLMDDWVDSRGEDTIYVKTVLHIVGRNDGSGSIPLDVVFNQLCLTNNVYNKFGVVLYVSDIQYINNTDYYLHNQTDGHRMMQQYEVQGALNLFFVGDPAGACGYYSPSADCIALKNTCLGPNAYTMAHEIGHYFSLPHTFLGWEGKIYDPNQSTPYSVNGHLTETVDRSNCNQAADGFCDTWPDYLSYRWACNNNKESALIQTDVNGEEFRSDGTLIMGYSVPGCATRFTEQQISAILYNINVTRNLNGSKPNLPDLDDYEITGINPAMDEEVYFDGITFLWDKIEGALAYTIQYSPLPSFSERTTIEATVTDPHYVPDTIYPSWHTIYWRIKPFGVWGKCNNEFSRTFSFSTKTTAVNNVDLSNNRFIYPNPITQGQILHIITKNPLPGMVAINIYDARGKIVRTIHRAGGIDEMSIDIHSLSSGVYVIQLLSQSGSSSHKLLVIK